MTLPTAVRPITVLLVEDNPGDARLIIEMLAEIPAQLFTLEQFDRLEPALARLSRASVDVVLLDLGLPDSKGLETFQRTQREAPDEPIVIISGLDDERLALDAVRAGAQDYLVKGRIEGQLLARVLRYAVQRKQGEQMRRASEARLSAILSAALDAHVTMDATGAIAGWNPQAEVVFGWTAVEVLGRELADIIIPPGSRDAHRRGLARFLATGEGPILNRRMELTALHRDGHEFQVELAVTPVRVDDSWLLSAFIRDVTERQRLENQLRQASKMEAIGRLAGGVAHDFNNILTTIFGYTDLVVAELPADSPILQDLTEVRKAAARAASLTGQLLAFSRQQVLQPTVLNLNDIVVNLQKMLDRLIGENVELRVALAPDLGNVRTDAGQLEQVVLNLMINARDALPTGGRIMIETANVELSDEYAEAHQPVAAGAYVMLAMSDTGIGMDRETRTRLFEPFFTTKEKGKGTGLGLATVYGIVKQSGGYIWVYSEPGHGATFKVYLPRVDEMVEPQEQQREPAGAMMGTETILVAEDDELLRPLTSNILRKSGYQVIAAASAEEALAAAKGHDGPIHLLLADVVMPGESGRQLARRLAEVRPETRVLYVSGYTDDAIVHHGMLEPGLNYLQKPFTPASLARKVREVLDAK